MTPLGLVDWAQRHAISAAALSELRAILTAPAATLAPLPDPRQRPEAYVQSQVRLEAAQKGLRLWRNNVGVLKDINGRPVRFGLANDSPALNEKLKSGDLIGWRPVTITPAHVGTILAQFVSRECKPAGWKFTGGDREEAQATWSALVTADGGDAGFTNGPGSL